ncbi:MAG: hypothetical protein Q9226_001481 [Calogaya cf. arnoldii]
MSLCDESCPVRSYRTDYNIDSLQSDDGKSQPPYQPSAHGTLPIWDRRLRPTQIRILCIEPGHIDTPVVTFLSIANMTFYDGVELDDTKESITYEALSYSWGSPAQTSSIQCNGHKIPVRMSLYDALIHLRLPDKPRYIWVDALCINQSDNEEKSVQVFRMSSVYYKAVKVIAYLGQTYSCSGSALQLLEKADLRKAHANTCRRGFKYLLLSLQLLLKAPWFTRTWVRQEVFMANRLDVQSGFVSLDWERFVANATALLTQGQSMSIATHDSHEYHLLTRVPATLHLLRQGNAEDKAKVVLKDVHRSESHDRDLDVVLRGSKHFDASDPRDFVYGVASMTTAQFHHKSSELHPNPLEEASIKIDYRLSVQSVYENTTVYLMQQARSVDPMFFAYETRRQGTSQEEYASWCPDWSLLPEKSVLDWVWSAMEQVEQDRGLNTRILYHHFKSVTDHEQPRYQNRTPLFANIAHMRDRPVDCPVLCTQGELVCSGLISGHLKGYTCDPEKMLEFEDSWWKQEWKSEYVPVQIGPLDTPGGKSRLFQPRWIPSAFTRKSARPAARAPMSWREGDVVAYIRSSSLLAVLRPATKTNSYRLVGPLISSRWTDTFMEVREYSRGNNFSSMHEAFMAFYNQELPLQNLVLI